MPVILSLGITRRDLGWPMDPIYIGYGFALAYVFYLRSISQMLLSHKGLQFNRY